MEFGEFCGVAAEGRVFAGAVLQAGEVGFEFARRFGGKLVHHPVAFALGFDEAANFEIAEVLGDFHLGFAEDFLEVANAKWAVAEEREDAQAGAVTETFVDADQFHRKSNMHAQVYSASGILIQSGKV